MAPTELSSRDSSESFQPNDDGYRKPLQNFEISDSPLENGLRWRQRGGWRTLWPNMAVRARQKQQPYEDGEEADGLLDSTNVSGTQISHIGMNYPCSRWCIYGGNTALSILLLLVLLNLLFGFATFLQLPNRPDPFSEWGKPGTTSEGLSWYPTDFLRDVIPIPCHSHNDYWREVPLFSALYNGCISIEADVWALNNDLFIGHNTASLTANRTFQSLYVNPLVKILERQNPTTGFYNGTSNGVFDTDPKQSLALVVDVKTDGAETWPLVLQQLEPLRRRGLLSYMENGAVQRRPITVVGTGETPFNILTANQTYRDAFFDAPLDQMDDEELEDGETIQPGLDNIDDTRGVSTSGKTSPRSAIAPPNGLDPLTSLHRRGQGRAGTSPTDSYTQLNSFYASTSFNEVIGRIWWGKLSNDQISLIRNHVRGAHDRGLKARYWDLPSWPTSLRNYVWDVLVMEGVDVLNVDDLEAVRTGVW